MAGEILILCCYLLTALSAAWFGVMLSKAPKWQWLSVCGFAIGLLFVILLARRVPAIGYHPGMLLLGQSRIAEILFCGLAPLLFGILCPHLPHRRQRRMVTVFAVLASLYLGLVCQVEFLLAYHRLADLNTWVEDKVCLQTTHYTCGAAAAVSALYQYDIMAEEGPLALASRTTPSIGTTEYLLAEAIEALYADRGISCRIRRFDSVEQLKGNCPMIAVVKLRLGVDHFVTVLDVTSTEIVIADPMAGKAFLSHDDFAGKWRYAGILIQKN